MFKNMKKLITVFALSFGLLLVPAAVVVGTAGAQNITGNLCSGVNIEGPGDGDCASQVNDGGVTSAVQTIVNWLSWFVGVVSVIMIVVGGFRYITSGGASDKVTSAKNTIIYAIIGLVIVALAQFIVRFVVTKAGGVETPML